MTNWSGRNQFVEQEAKSFIVNNKSVGFIKSAQNLIFVGLDNAGHFAPKDVPKVSLTLLEKFTSGILYE
jgi:carboxypeptidase C (cathepsin A)